MTKKILIVEDEFKLAELLKDYLQQASFDVNVVSDGNQVMTVISQYQPDLVLLDIMLPNKDGLSLCREIRQDRKWNTLPIIMTTAKVDEIDRLLGLEIGADDYVCKPYSPREVVARVKAVLRRQYDLPKPLDIGLVLDNERMKAEFYGEDIGLTAVEFALLKMLASNPGKVYSRSQLMDAMYNDYRVVSERTIDSHIKKLRHKISAINSDVELIHSVYGVGYKLEPFDSI